MKTTTTVTVTPKTSAKANAEKAKANEERAKNHAMIVRTLLNSTPQQKALLSSLVRDLAEALG